MCYILVLRASNATDAELVCLSMSASEEDYRYSSVIDDVLLGARCLHSRKVVVEAAGLKVLRRVQHAREKTIHKKASPNLKVGST